LLGFLLGCSDSTVGKRRMGRRYWRWLVRMGMVVMMPYMHRRRIIIVMVMMLVHAGCCWMIWTEEDDTWSDGG